MSEATALSPKSGRSVNRMERWLAPGVDWIVLVSLLLAFALRLTSALGTYLNPDEALHHLLVNQTSFLGAYRASLTNAHPPLYFALLYYWRMVGNSEVMLRLPSVLASTAAAWMAFRWITTVLGRAAGLTTLLLLAFSPVVTALGAEVRNYSLLLLWMTSALYFLERAFRDQKVSSIGYSSLFLYLAILTHYSALWFVLATGIYVLLRISSLTLRARIAWMLLQLGAAALYVWLYLVHISKMRGSPMEAEAMTGWLRALYFRAGESPWAFLQRANVDVFQFLFGSRVGGDVALGIFIAGVLWLLVAGMFRKSAQAASRGIKRKRNSADLAVAGESVVREFLNSAQGRDRRPPYGGGTPCNRRHGSVVRGFPRGRDRAAFGLLLLLPFVFGMTAALLDFYPYGGTRHCIYLVLFATAAVSFLIATIVRQRLLPILLLAVLVIPYWYLHRLPDPQQMNRKEEAKELMTNAIADLRTSVPPDEPIFTDYQASILLAYYLDRDHPSPAPRECGGVTEVQYGPYRVVIVNGWSATAAQLMTGLDSWRKGCDSVPRDSFWIFDAGWGLNLLDDLNQSVPRSISQAQRFGQTISLFKLRTPD